MNTDTMPEKPRALYKVINIFLIILNSIFAFGICSTYSFDTLLFYKKVILIVPAVLLTAFMIIKEFIVKHLIKKMYLNIFICMGFILIIFCWVSLW